MIRKRGLIYGYGVNDSDYNVKTIVDGKIKYCPYFSVWRDMIKRGYSTKYKSKYPTYNDCSVCTEWKSFTSFKLWMEKQDWEGNDLDKDILFEGNKTYSPDRCVFVTHETNSFMVNCSNSSTAGVFESKGKYVARVRIGNGERLTIGTYHTIEQAHCAYALKKRELAVELSKRQSDTRVAKALLTMFNGEPK